MLLNGKLNRTQCTFRMSLFLHNQIVYKARERTADCWLHPVRQYIYLQTTRR